MEKGKISSLQMALIMYPTIIATAILGVPSVTSRIAANDFWLASIFASFFGFLAVYLAHHLHKLYPKQTIAQYTQQILGKPLGKLICALIFIFYIQCTGHLARSYAEFIIDSFLFRTPMSVIVISILFLCALTVRQGIEIIGRAAGVFFPFFVFPLAFLIILVFPEFEFRNLYPVLSEGLLPSIQASAVPSGWFAEFFLISFLLPFVSDQKKAWKKNIITIIAVTITHVIVDLIVLFTLGVSTQTKIYPLMNIARYINVADFFENLEAIVMAVWVIGAFIKISMFYYVAVVGTAQTLNLSDYRIIVWPIGILAVAYSFWSLPNLNAFASYDTIIFPPYSIVIQILIPLLLLIVALIRNRKKGTKNMRSLSS